MKKLLILFFILLSVFTVFADDIQEFNSAKKDFDYIEHSDRVTRKSYLLVADKFYKVYASAPRGSMADEALHYCAQTYYRSYSRFGSREDLLKALRNMKVLAINYDSKLATMAFMQSAKIYEQQKDYPSAQYMLRKLIAKFPKSDEAKEAKDRLDAIDNRFSNVYADSGKTQVKPKPIIRDTGKKPVVDSKPVVAVKPAVKEEDDTADNSATSKQVAYGDINTPEKIPDGKAALKRVRYFSTADYTRVVLDMSGRASFDKHWLKADPSIGKPPRLFIDLNEVVVSPEIPQDIEIKDGLLRSLRWAYNRPGVARIVLDSDNVQDFTVFAMTDPERVVIDVSSASVPTSPKADPVKTTDVARPADNSRIQVGTGGSSTLASVFGLKIKSVVIDPGHGGKDPGATYYGIQEKDVVLDIGLELAKMIKDNNPDINVYMTRNKDVFIPLEERTAFANRKKADLFISVHVNAAPNKNARGVETFVLNVTNDKKALQVAAFENQTTQKSMSDLQGILKDIMLNSKLEESIELASYVQKSSHKALYNDNRFNLGVKQAPFYVLVGAKMPSILVETGFVSNKEEADNLATDKYRKDIAKGIYDGIFSYINIRNGK
ncbi:MAG: N-acetylmuramoyl-L-alanine amidase [Deferribacterales bacterium]